uniref:DH domain-containing protein n=1 Tax=Knipowitschia caucasica TaxID=637954 RepID=A0AAV2IQB3_KNICA
MRPSPPPCSTSTSHSTPHSTSHSTSHSTPHSTSHSTPSSSISSIQAQRQRWEQRCIRTSTELLQTERTYCAQLRLVTTYFVELLEAKGTLKADVRKKVFSSSREIHNLNQSLLVHLENGFLSRGFDQFCSELHHYKQYADDFYDSQRALRTQVKKSKAFRRFKKLQEGRVEFNELKLEDLLELPLTRAIQYHVFLEELTSNTSPQHQDFTALSRVVVLLSDLSLRIRENSRREENLLYLQNIQRVLRPKTRIIQPGESRDQVRAETRWRSRDQVEEQRPGGGAETRWRSRDQVEKQRPGGGAETRWRSRDQVEEQRPGGGAETRWRSRDQVEEQRPGGGAETRWRRSRDQVEEQRPGGGAETRWRSRDQVEEQRPGGGAETGWRSRDRVEEQRPGGGAETGWRSRDRVEEQRPGGGAETGWRSRDRVEEQRPGGGAETGWRSRDRVEEQRPGGGAETGWRSRDRVEEQRPGGGAETGWRSRDRVEEQRPGGGAETGWRSRDRVEEQRPGGGAETRWRSRDQVEEQRPGGGAETGGSEGKLQLFFLMSDVLLQTRRSSALSLSGGDHLELQRVFPLKDCGLEKVFGHKGGEGGLLSLSFPDTKLLLMSCDQSDFNHWFRALSSALRDLQPKDPVLQCESSAPCRKRHATPAADSSSDTKRRKEDTAARASSCVLL